MALKSMMKKMGTMMDGKTLWGALYRHGSLRKTSPLTPEEQKYLNDLGAKRCKVGLCYMNAQSMVVSDHHRKNPRLKYVEGLVTVHGVPIDHAWVEINGKVADPTPINPQKKFIPEYFGIEIPAKDVLVHMLKRKMYSPLTQDEYGEKFFKTD